MNIGVCGVNSKGALERKGGRAEKKKGEGGRGREREGEGRGERREERNLDAAEHEHNLAHLVVDFESSEMSNSKIMSTLFNHPIPLKSLKEIIKKEKKKRKRKEIF